MLAPHEDALGNALQDYLKFGEAIAVLEWDDGYIEGYSVAPYFSPYNSWPEHEKEALQRVTGNALDIGCGSGRHLLYLQEQGVECTGIDISPKAIEVCKKRGVRKALVMGIEEIDEKIGIFDTILLLGNNFGLLQNMKQGKAILRQLYDITSSKGIILAQSLDPHQTKDEHHKRYVEAKLKSGQFPIAVRMRSRYLQYATPWFDYLMVSLEEMKQVIDNTGWEMGEIIKSNRSPMFVGVLNKKD